MGLRLVSPISEPRCSERESVMFVVTIRFKNGRWLDERTCKDISSMLKYVYTWTTGFANVIIRVYPGSQLDLVKYIELMEEV